MRQNDFMHFAPRSTKTTDRADAGFQPVATSAAVRYFLPRIDFEIYSISKEREGKPRINANLDESRSVTLALARRSGALATIAAARRATARAPALAK